MCVSNVVVIEDEAQIAAFVQHSLESAGFQVFVAENGARGLIECSNRKPDLILLDLGLPDMDGVAVMSKLRSWSPVPIIVLSARTQESSKIQALDAGADDYLTKPFSMAELLARVRAHMRRFMVTPAQPEMHVRFGEVEVDLDAKTVTRKGEPVSLTPIEFRLLTSLIRQAGKVMTHRQLLSEVWGPGHVDRGHYLRIYMGHLRQKLENDPAQPVHILTEVGAGYRFVVGE
ncbi:response regulator [Burkholderiaceae bacterium DAT-1]|nr:response regulator [Burkholderiaceae bacterium DAT-1]